MSIHEAFLLDYDEQTAPPENDLLRVAVVADVAFLSIGKREGEGEDGENGPWKAKAECGVNAEALLHLLIVMVRSADEEAFQRLRDGKLPETHPSLVAASIATPTVGIRRRV